MANIQPSLIGTGTLRSISTFSDNVSSAATNTALHAVLQAGIP